MIAARSETPVTAWLCLHPLLSSLLEALAFLLFLAAFVLLLHGLTRLIFYLVNDRPRTGVVLAAALIVAIRWYEGYIELKTSCNGPTPAKTCQPSSE